MASSVSCKRQKLASDETAALNKPTGGASGASISSSTAAGAPEAARRTRRATADDEAAASDENGATKSAAARSRQATNASAPATTGSDGSARRRRGQSGGSGTPDEGAGGAARKGLAARGRKQKQGDIAADNDDDEDKEDDNHGTTSAAGEDEADEADAEQADDDEDDEDDEDEDEDEDEDDDDDENDAEEDDDDEDEDETEGESAPAAASKHAENGPACSRAVVDICDQLAAAGPAGVAAAAAIGTGRKRKRAHSFETNPSVRKRQQTRLIRKLRACLDEYTMRVGQQAVVLITMPGKAAHNIKVFGAQPLESVIRACKQEIMAELEQALLEQAPQQFNKDDANKHELPPLVIDGIPTPVEKMTQAQLRAFIPLMLKYSTGRGKPGWGKESTRPPWWPETLPWANVRSDAREEDEKQRISWTTTLRQIVTNCYKYHGRDDLLPSFDETATDQAAASEGANDQSAASRVGKRLGLVSRSSGHQSVNLNLSAAEADASDLYHQHQQQYAQANYALHTIANGDGSVSLIQVDSANAQILTLPDGTQVRAVRLQTLGSDAQLCATGQTMTKVQDQTGGQHQQQHQQQAGQTLTLSEAGLGADGQIIVTGEDGLQSCYPMSSLVSIPASLYQQFAQGGQQLSIVTADGQSVAPGTITLHALDESGHQQELPQDALETLQSGAHQLGQQVVVTSGQRGTNEQQAGDKHQGSADIKHEASA